MKGRKSILKVLEPDVPELNKDIFKALVPYKDMVVGQGKEIWRIYKENKGEGERWRFMHSVDRKHFDNTWHEYLRENYSEGYFKCVPCDHTGTPILSGAMIFAVGKKDYTRYKKWNIYEYESDDVYNPPLDGRPEDCDGWTYRQTFYPTSKLAYPDKTYLQLSWGYGTYMTIPFDANGELLRERKEVFHLEKRTRKELLEDLNPKYNAWNVYRADAKDNTKFIYAVKDIEPTRDGLKICQGPGKYLVCPVDSQGKERRGLAELHIIPEF
ncbi:MAG: hypothetical protein HN929_12575 [Chloroflexi bacterium]|jgi:hypothetical protein|nr:hypothetical protein [Chloroflexota bacterium]